MADRRTAVVLFNLGGPDRIEATRPFLYNLFSDRAIIDLPAPLRQLVAVLISWRRATTAQVIYAHIGGRSPILEETKKQAAALSEALVAGGAEALVFVAMRYWHPFAGETAREVAAWGPSEIILVPLYPQFSTTTTASSVDDWYRAARRAGLAVPTRAICCYPADAGLAAGHARLLREALAAVRSEAPNAAPRVLFSAHGLPKKILARGDPYAWQVEQTARAIVAALGEPDLDWLICYQSRVGPMEWIGPATEDELRRAGAGGVPVVVLPIAFVSEHSETIVELDIEYRRLAVGCGVPAYVRVPAIGTDASFINGLAGMVQRLVGAGSGVPICSGSGSRLCPADFRACRMAAAKGR
jgi:ferrochelatase